MNTSKNCHKSPQESNVLVVGVTRNSGDRIVTEIHKLNEAFKIFKTIKWLIVESDSDDNTISELHGLKEEIYNFDYKSAGTLRNKLPLRTQRIAYCRNIYLKELNNNNIYTDIDYVLVADLDGVNTLLTPESIASCWLRNNWDVCTANQLGPYYDIWALRHQLWSPNDCWQQYSHLRKYNLSNEKALFSSVHSKMITIKTNENWIEVDSAFGGISIYRRDVLQNVEYIGLNENNEELCEHVTLHKMIKDKGGHIFINPKFTNAAYTEHTRALLFLPSLKRRLQQVIKNILHPDKGSV